MLGIDLPLWIIVLSPIIVLPAVFYARSELHYWKCKRKAESLGARLAPTVPFKWPAGIDLIVAISNVFKNGYLGESRGLGVPCMRVSCGDTR